MTDAWGGHQAAAFNAINAVGELQEALSLATDACERVIGAIVEATGRSNTPAAQSAVEIAAGMKERVNEIYGMSENCKAELDRYVGGF